VNPGILVLAHTSHLQETRKIVGAVSAKITFEDWLPRILGPVAAEVLNNFDEYNPEVNAGIANAISAAVMRFGHTLVSGCC
jgi:peroxidase